jgi:two-component system, sensor histidine kinase and response regulator
MPLSNADLGYRRLFETIHVGILLLDYETRVIRGANPFLATMSGFDIDELVGKKISQTRLFDSTLTGKKIFDDLKKVDEVFYENTPLLTKGGGTKIVAFSAHTYEFEGKIMIQCLIRDLTEKRKAQSDFFETTQRLEALMNALPVGVTFSLDPKVKHIQVNPYMKKKMEMEPDEHIVATNKETLITGHKYRHFQNGRELKPKELPMQRAIAENRLVGPIEGETLLPSGKLWHVEGYGAPIHDRQGKIIGAVAVNVDLTERQKAREAEKLGLQVKQEKEKLGFIADAAHELRTPLAIIRGNVDLALQKKTDPNEALEAINVEVIHLTDILSDLALLTTKEGDFRKNMGTHYVELDKLVENIAERHVSMAAKRGIKVHVAKLPRLKITGDDFYLERLFTNIISNAVSYGKDGGNVWIDGKIEGKCVKITIKDDGVGISEKDLPLIFERFYRAEGSRSKDYGGSGLGLAIVKWIAEAHGGSVEATSKVGKGSTFTVSFPILRKRAEKKHLL